MTAIQNMRGESETEEALPLPNFYLSLVKRVAAMTQPNLCQLTNATKLTYPHVVVNLGNNLRSYLVVEEGSNFCTIVKVLFIYGFFLGAGSVFYNFQLKKS